MGRSRSRMDRSSAGDANDGGRTSTPLGHVLRHHPQRIHRDDGCSREAGPSSFANRGFVRPGEGRSIHPEGSTTRLPCVERGAYAVPVSDVDDPPRSGSASPSHTSNRRHRSRVPPKGGMGGFPPVSFRHVSLPPSAEGRTREETGSVCVCERDREREREKQGPTNVVGQIEAHVIANGPKWTARRRLAPRRELDLPWRAEEPANAVLRMHEERRVPVRGW